MKRAPPWPMADAPRELRQAALSVHTPSGLGLHDRKNIHEPVPRRLLPLRSVIAGYAASSPSPPGCSCSRTSTRLNRFLYRSPRSVERKASACFRLDVSSVYMMMVITRVHLHTSSRTTLIQRIIFRYRYRLHAMFYQCFREFRPVTSQTMSWCARNFVS